MLSASSRCKCVSLLIAYEGIVPVSAGRDCALLPRYCISQLVRRRLHLVISQSPGPVNTHFVSCDELLRFRARRDDRRVLLVLKWRSNDGLNRNSSSHSRIFIHRWVAPRIACRCVTKLALIDIRAALCALLQAIGDATQLMK